MNKVILVGRLTRNPEVRYTQGENSLAITRYTLAVDRRFRKQGQGGDQQEADFIPCVVFGKGAEFAENYFKQGMRVSISGRIQTGSYTNKDGQKVYTTEVVVEDQEFAESRNEYQANQGGGANQGAARQSQPAARPEPAQAAGDGFMNIPDGIDEELPFN